MDIVSDMYRAFGDRDERQLRTLIDPDVVWIQNDGFPGGGGERRGIEAVLADVFGKFRSEWAQWQVEIDRMYQSDEAVFVLGEYIGIFKATGRSMRAAFAHVYWVRDDRIVRFQQFTDTRMIAQAMGQ